MRKPRKGHYVSLPPDFRSIRQKLPAECFLWADGPEPKPTDLVHRETWDGIMHLPDDVAIRSSDHNGIRLSMLYSLWGDWITATGDPGRPDELFGCMLDAADALQCATFLAVHGFYRAAMAELRVAVELVLVGTYGNLKPNEPKYLNWKKSGGELPFGTIRNELAKALTGVSYGWIFEKEEFINRTYRKLCNFTHSRPDSSDGVLWRSNGPVYVHEMMIKIFLMAMSVYAICYLLVRLSRPISVLPRDSRILFEEDWIPEREGIARAFEQLYREKATPVSLSP